MQTKIDSCTEAILQFLELPKICNLTPFDEMQLASTFNMLLSGGADGADLHFATCATKASHFAAIMIFETHKRHDLQNEYYKILQIDIQNLQLANAALKRANARLKRNIGTQQNYTMQLLQRNYYQIKYADAVYAVGYLQDSVIQGGTAWACYMFLDKFVQSQGLIVGAKPIPLYFYCQNADKWHQMQSNATWQVIAMPPNPTGKYAGIGSRELYQNGKQAIASLYAL